MSQHRIRIGDQKGKQPELDRRQMDRLAVLLDDALAEVDAHPTEFEHRLAGGAGTKAPPQLRTNPSEQFRRTPEPTNLTLLPKGQKTGPLTTPNVVYASAEAPHKLDSRAVVEVAAGSRGTEAM